MGRDQPARQGKGARQSAQGWHSPELEAGRILLRGEQEGMSVLQASGRHRHYGETPAESSRWRRFIFRQQFHQRREEKEEESEKWLGHIGRAFVWECLSLFFG